MQVLIIGGGGREHALAWKIAQSDKVTKVFIAPGNAGTALDNKLENVAINADDISNLIHFAQQENIGLTIVGPEAPLVLGVVDQFQAAGLRCLGPSQAAAQLEGSKAFMKAFLQRHQVPTAAYAEFSQLDQALAYVQQAPYPLVIKADGLAAGKGVVICQNLAEAETTINNMLSGQAFGEAGKLIVIEEFLAGEEASFMVLVDGKNVVSLATSQDHKARDDGDIGPNTGGMGAYSPAPVVTPELHQKIMQTVIEPTVQGMIKDGHPYTGFLYAGLMIDANDEIKVLEFNCRMGDPETQPIMFRLKSDLVTLCDAALDQRLDQMTTEWDSRTALGVVLAAGGYPANYNKGDVISGLDSTPTDIKVFHAGTAEKNGQIVTAGGRVLCVCALGDTVKAAQNKAYEGVSHITWDQLYYRHDIGHRAIKREQS